MLNSNGYRKAKRRAKYLTNTAHEITAYDKDGKMILDEYSGNTVIYCKAIKHNGYYKQLTGGIGRAPFGKVKFWEVRVAGRILDKIDNPCFEEKEYEVPC